MKIAVIVSEIPKTEGGAAVFQEMIVGAISNHGNVHQHEFVIFDYSSNANYQTTGGIKTYGLKSDRYPLCIALIFRRISIKISHLIKLLIGAPVPRVVGHHELLDRLVDELGVDLVWFLTPRSFITNCPFMVTLWDLQHRLQPFFPEVSRGSEWDDRENHYKRILPRATKVITGTNAGKNEAINFYCLNPDNVIVAPFPAPSFHNQDLSQDEVFSAVTKRPGYKSFFLYPAQFWPHKNHINLLRAYKIASDKNSEFPILVLTGSDKGNKDRVISEAERLGISSSIDIVGFITREQLVWFYKNAYALIFPTWFGPDNIPPLEAFALGCPVLASKVSGSEEQLQDAALLFDPSDIEGMSEAMQRIYLDENLRNHLINKGFKLVHSLTPKNYVNGVMGELKKIDTISQNWR
jgi:glycosyltransferase involved in cell wall biosynthesis